jgi:hypothetical protein
MLIVRAPEVSGNAQKMFHDAILQIVRRRKFPVTDKGFAGVATPMLQIGYTVAIIPGMLRCAVLREVGDPLEELGIHVNVQEVEGARARGFHRITAYMYVGCHDGDDFGRRKKEGFGNGWRLHCCLRREMDRWHIVWLGCLKHSTWLPLLVAANIIAILQSHYSHCLASNKPRISLLDRSGRLCVRRGRISMCVKSAGSGDGKS